MSLFPGLCGDAPAAASRVFMGVLPNLITERRLVRQLQPVFPWFQSRRRVKEFAQEFIELDLASVDSETMLRYCHIFYVRRVVHNDSFTKQLAMLESGKSPKQAEAPLLACLAELNSRIVPRLEEELTLLSTTKKTSKFVKALLPARKESIEAALAAGTAPLVFRELEPGAPLEPCDYLAMMRVCEEAAGGIEDNESKCKTFLPATHMYGGLRKLAVGLVGSDDVKPDLDKRELKLLSRMTLPDYSKIGCVEKYRPCDVTALYRFYGERIVKSGDIFTRCLWGHVFRKFSTHPSFLVSMSKNWVTSAGIATQTTMPHLPIEHATAAWTQQQQFPALKFRAQYMYTSADHARQAWKTDHFIPLMRLFPLTGQFITEDLAANILVEGYWSKLHLAPSDNVHDESFWRGVREFVKEMGTLRESNMDGLLVRLVEAFPRAVPVEKDKKSAENQEEKPKDPPGGNGGTETSSFASAEA